MPGSDQSRVADDGKIWRSSATCRGSSYLQGWLEARGGAGVGDG